MIENNTNKENEQNASVGVVSSPDGAGEEQPCKTDATADFAEDLSEQAEADLKNSPTESEPSEECQPVQEIADAPESSADQEKNDPADKTVASEESAEESKSEENESEESESEESKSEKSESEENESEEEEAPQIVNKDNEPAPLPQPRLTREERFRMELEELSRKHAEEVARNVELAKDPSLYDTYRATVAGTDEKIRIFNVRRQGRSHISDKSPCQDYCLTADTAKGVILTDADGVGSCARSDVGSRLACEVTVAFIRELDQQCETEEQLVGRLCTLRFRELLVKRWLQAVLAHAKENPNETTVPSRMYELYGSTLMFALITEHYYVVGNLGDGQILLFNQFEGVKLRLHPPKDSTKVRALVNPNCYREDFQVNKYSRKDFSGVLLTTDGMYDVLCNGNMLYRYARQIEKRFLDANEPLQPFCFVEGEEPMKDLFSHRTKDDCSIVLAIDTAFDAQGLDSRMDLIGKGMDYVVPYRMEGDLAFYLLQKDQEMFYGIVSPAENALTDLSYLPIMEGIRWVWPLNRYIVNNYRCSIYPATDARSLEELYHWGILREQTERAPNASKETLRVYGALLRCKRLLEENGYCLIPFAHLLMRFGAKGEILLPNEAVMPLAERQADDAAKIDRFFDSLMGKLVSDEDEYPVFRLGYFSAGQRMFLSNSTRGPMYRVMRDAQGTVSLMNEGNSPWITPDGTVASKEKLPISNGLTFRVSTNGGAPVTYRYVSKEEM